MKAFMLSLLSFCSSLLASEGAELYKQCVACHGINGEKKALNRSEIIAGWESSKTQSMLQEYRAGMRDVKGMGKLMQGKVAAYSDDEIEAVADYISSLGK